MPQPLSAHVVAAHLERVRKNAPLTHVITNDVVTGFTANVLLALGAAPAMITAPEEAGSFAAIASALSVNVGTLTSTQAATIRIAVQAANQANTPWPVFQSNSLGWPIVHRHRRGWVWRCR